MRHGIVAAAPGAAQWFTTSSYGRLTLDVTPVRRFFRMPQPSSAYGFQRGLSFAAGSGPVKVIDAHPATAVCGNGLNDAMLDLGAGEVSSFANPAAVRGRRLHPPGYPDVS